MTENPKKSMEKKLHDKKSHNAVTNYLNQIDSENKGECIQR